MSHDVHPDVVWRDGAWHCRYVPNTHGSPGGTVSLHNESSVLVAVQTETLDEMLRVALLWRETLTRPRARRNVLQMPSSDSSDRSI